MKAVFGLSYGHTASEVARNGKDNVESQDARNLKNLGIQIAIALAIHNFPEGLSTFATAIATSRIGIIYAIALSL
ncbi:16244_t:CDS:2, partial [Cetraspora pellucida]